MSSTVRTSATVAVQGEVGTWYLGRTQMPLGWFVVLFASLFFFCLSHESLCEEEQLSESPQLKMVLFLTVEVTF